jgi:hypothetical protein
MSLNSVGGIVAEQSRLYRLWINGRIKSGEMTRGMFGLREIRCSIEALPPEPEVYNSPTINIVEVPSGYCIKNVEQLNGLSNGAKTLQLEHSLTPENFDCAPEIASESETQLHEERIISDLKREINSLAQKLGVDIDV